MRYNHDDDDDNIGRRTRLEKPYVIQMSRVRNSLDIKLEPNLANVLNDTKAKLRIEIGADNFAHVSVVDEESGDKIGTLGDIERIAKFRRFIEEERKITKNLDILGPIEGRLVNAFKHLIAQKEWKDLSFPNIRADQIVALKESERRTRRLSANKEILLAYMKDKPKMDPQEYEICSYILNWLIGSLEANAKLYEWVLTGADSIEKLSDEIFSQVVPAWSYKRLSQMNFALITDMRRVVFPQNTRSGVHFSVKEILNRGFRNRHLSLLACSGFQLKLLGDPKSLKTALNLQVEPNLENVHSLEAQDLKWLADFPILVSPLWFGIEYLFEPKAKGKVPDFDLPKYSTPQSTLKSIVSAMVSMQVFEFRTDQQIGEIWDRLSVGLGINGIFREGITAKNNLYRVALTQKKLLEDRVRSVIHCNGAQAKNFMRIRTRAQLKLSTGSELEKIIFKCAGLDDLTRKGSYIGPLSAPPSERRQCANMFDALSEPTMVTDAGLVKTVQQNIGIRKSSNVKADHQYGITVTALSDASTRFLDRLKLKRSTAVLVPGIENWLKSFVHRNFQDAGLKQVQLQLEDMVFDEERSPGENDPDDDDDDDE
jgi:hypothetical protein